MEMVFSMMGPGAWVAALAIGAVAGLVKGMVGFALPLILISGLGSFLPPELALAGLILPTLVSNAIQALRQGFGAAWGSLKRFGLFLSVGLIFLSISSQLVRVLPVGVILALIGGPVAVFCLMQLFGWSPHLKNGRSRVLEVLVGTVAGFLGGLSGVWGPPLVAYLTAIDTEKTEQVRIQGVAYFLGAIALAGAHVVSGVLNAQTAPFSVLLLVPVLAGMWVGTRIHDRIDQRAFRRVTLVVLLLAALNLLRRAFLG